MARITEDAAAGELNAPASTDPDTTAEWIAERVPDAVTWEGWLSIDEHERRAGEPQGRPRVKLVKLSDLIAAARAGTTAR